MNDHGLWIYNLLSHYLLTLILQINNIGGNRKMNDAGMGIFILFSPYLTLILQINNISSSRKIVDGGIGKFIQLRTVSKDRPESEKNSGIDQNN